MSAKRISKADTEKMREFVEEAIGCLGGRLVKTERRNDGIRFKVEGCDLSRLEDFVNQRMGHYAYPWTSWMKSETELEMGFEEYEK